MAYLNDKTSLVRPERRLGLQVRGLGLRPRLGAATPYLLILAVGAFLFRAADRIEFDHVDGRIGPDAWPKLIISLMMVASVLGGIKAARSQDTRSSEPVSSGPRDEGGQGAMAPDDAEIYPLRVWGTLAGTVAYLLLMPAVGFFLSSALFIAFIVYLGGYRKVGPVLAIALVGSLFFMVIFVRVIYVSLPIGIEPFAAVSLTLLKIINV